MIKEVPLNKFGNPENISDAVAFFVHLRQILLLEIFGL